MTKTIDWLQLCDDIDDGAVDDGLDDLAKAINSRRDIVHRRNARRLQRTLEVGDRVMLTNRISPRYLEGCTAVILKLQDGAAVCKLDALPTHRGRPPAEGPLKKLLVPFVNLVKLDSDIETITNHDIAADIGDDDDEEDDEDD